MRYFGQRVQLKGKIVPRKCIAHPEQSAHSSANFLRKIVSAFVHKGIKGSAARWTTASNSRTAFPSKDEIKISPLTQANGKLLEKRTASHALTLAILRQRPLRLGPFFC